MGTDSGRVRVIVADDHPLYREGIVRAVKEREDLELVGEAGDGQEALDMIKELEPDVAVLDIRMPKLEGTQVLEALRRDGAPTAVLFLSAFMESELAYRTVADGARGYLSKESSRQEICDAIATIADGGVALAPEAQVGLAREIQFREAEESRPALTPREAEVLGYISQGLSAVEIGERIGLSPTTVKTHLHGLYEKLGVSDRAAAVAEAMRRRLIE
jgi:two-component system, NarL family, nitrate/nitrite response regulator NarL